MTRPSEAILSRPEMEAILTAEEVGCLCLVEKDAPYGVPLSYAWMNGRIVIHCGLEGRKLDAIRSNASACFVVSKNFDAMRPHRAEGKCEFRFESVVCRGKARVIEDVEERAPLLDRFRRYFYERLGIDAEVDPVTPAVARACTCIVIDVDEMTGRRNPARA